MQKVNRLNYHDMEHILLNLLLGIRWEILIKIEPEFHTDIAFSYYQLWKYEPNLSISMEINNLMLLRKHKPIDTRWEYTQ